MIDSSRDKAETDEAGLQMKVQAAVIGAGPAGLMAAEQLAAAGLTVHIFDAMPSAGRKFLRAGVGGLNLSHAEDSETFYARYSNPSVPASWVKTFDPQMLQEWALELGIETFTGSSGRIFPVQKKASPLLRAWLRRLQQQGVELHVRHRWEGWDVLEAGSGSRHRFMGPQGPVNVEAEVCVLAMGGASWARLGTDGAWAEALGGRDVECAPFKPANCGFNYDWSEHMRARFAGHPLKSVALSLSTVDGEFSRPGEAMVSRHGIQGSLVYHASRLMRDEIERVGQVQVYWDLLPGRTPDAIGKALKRPRGKESLGNYLRKRLGIVGVKAALLHELAGAELQQPEMLVQRIKQLPQVFSSCRPLDEAISSAGGVCLSQLDEQLMLRRWPGIFCAGEMLDWEAPTGGYLLNACMASGRLAGQGAAAFIKASGGFSNQD